MEERRVADYFVVTGLPLQESERVEEDPVGTHLKQSCDQIPITDLAVIFPTLGETAPPGFTIFDSTPTGLTADLNHGSLRSPEVFLCYRRGTDKPPLVDIGIMYEGKERLLKDAEILLTTPSGRPANVNNSTAKTFVTYRRAQPTMPCNALVVTDICVIITSKGETPPHTFCVINKNLNKGMVGSDVFLCYKKSVNQAPSITYKPAILSRYPPYERDHFPLPQSVPLFCLPMGATLEAWPVSAKQPSPVFSTFVLTVSDAVEKVYGSAVTFYEQHPKDKINEALRLRLRNSRQERKMQECDEDLTAYYVVKSICLLSHWPFFDAFEKFLQFLYSQSRSVSSTVPIEKYILNFMESVPFPSPQRPRILVQLSSVDRLILMQPEDQPLPRSGAGFHQLLMNLGPDNCLLLLLCALTEQKLLIHSLRPDVLTAVAEAVSMIIFPFKWQCPYIPLCPLSLAEVLHAPVPFLIGVDSRFFDLYDLPSDVNCVDLDTNNITLCEEKRYLTLKLLPKKPARILRSYLDELYCEFINQALENMKKKQKDTNIDKDFQLKRREQILELRIQEAFLRFMVLILKGYRSFLVPIIKAPTVGATDTNSLFNLQMFLRSRDKSNQKFYSLLTKTQMFIRFIEERSFVSDLDAGLAFFDECVDKVEQEENDHVPLLELDESHQSERTVFISLPENNSSSSHSESGSYQNGFILNPVLFTNKGATKNFLESNGVHTTPGSPMARRSKYEVKCAQKLARKYFCSPDLWAKCLLGTCYSLWFIHLPSFVLFTEHKVSSTLRIAYELLVRVQKTGLQPTDEVCYRVMMQLCGVYNQPMLAVKLLILMKRSGVQPNAITYGFYNRAVLESKWPSGVNNPGQLLWNKLRNVIHAVSLLRQIGHEATSRRRASSVSDTCCVDNAGIEQALPLSSTFANGSQSDIGYKSSSEGINDNQEENSEIEKDIVTNDEVEDIGEGSTLDTAADVTAEWDHLGFKGRRSSAITSRDMATFDKFCTRMGSIVKSSGVQLRVPPMSVTQQPFESSAGLLMTGGGNVIGFPETDTKAYFLENASSSLSPSPKIRNTSRINKRNRSGSCSEFTFSYSPRGARRYHSCYSPSQPPNSAKSTPKDQTNCYHILNRSESFANDAQILQNLQEVAESKLSTNIKIIGKSKFAKRRGSLGLQKLREYPKNESRASSMETLPSSGTGSMDDILSACSSATKRVMNNRMLNALTTKFTKSNDNSNRKYSASSVEENKQSPDSLSRVSSTPSLRSPVRTPVTENDPLGALSEETKAQEEVKTLPDLEVACSSSEIILDQTGAPVLFERRRKKWSSSDRDALTDDETINDGDEMEKEAENVKIKQRSATLPADVRESTEAQGSPFKTGLGSLSSNFKLPFSPSSLTSKKSNEIIMGGLSSLKNAASSMAKKIDEFKEAMSSNTTPLKDGSDGQCSDDTVCDNVQANTSGVVNGDETPVKRKISNEFSPSSVTQQLDSWGANLMELFGDGSRKGSASNLQPLGEHSPSSSHQSLVLLNERLYPKINRSTGVPVALELIMTTCSKCHHCSSLIYDEEIMAGWLPEDSNLNTKCPFCEKATVPLLHVNILDYRSGSELSRFASQESMSSVDKLRRKSSTNKLSASASSIGGSHLSVDSVAVDDEGKMKQVVTLDPIIVPYLNPLVLRKELESILNAEGDACLTRSSFVDEHPIIYWNLVWVFERIAVTSHVTGLCLQSACVLGKRDISTFHPSWSECDHRNVLVRTLWDNPQLHEEVGLPMYVLWNKNDKQSYLLSALLTDSTTIPRSLMERVITCIQCNDLEEPIRRIAAERTKLRSHGINHNFSLYRDILFLSFVALGRENIDHNAFDKEYMIALESLSPVERDSKIYMRCDNPNLTTSIYFRHYFKELEV